MLRFCYRRFFKATTGFVLRSHPLIIIIIIIVISSLQELFIRFVSDWYMPQTTVCLRACVYTYRYMALHHLCTRQNGTTEWVILIAGKKSWFWSTSLFAHVDKVSVITNLIHNTAFSNNWRNPRNFVLKLGPYLYI